PGKNYCYVSKDETIQAVCKMIIKISSQNHVTGDMYHANSNANSETLPNGWKKNKSRLNGSNSSQVETSHSLMNGEPRHKKLKTMADLDKHDHLTSTKIKNKNKRQAENTRASSMSEPRHKKLKTMADLDKHDHLTSTKIKNKNKRQEENTRASSMSKLLDRKSCEEVEIPTKKQKLKDQDDTPPNGMKRKLLVSRESSVDKSHEKNLNATSSRKDSKSKHFQFRATSISSKVSGSFRRASLQEVKASPVGSVSSSLLKAPNLNMVSPVAGRTISRKAHVKSSIRLEVPRKLLAREDNMQSCDIDASQSQKLGGTFKFKHKEASKFTSTTST
nr:hypothetical protein [Tanacetum cinerariifolium]